MNHKFQFFYDFDHKNMEIPTQQYYPSYRLFVAILQVPQFFWERSTVRPLPSYRPHSVVHLDSITHDCQIF